MRNFMLNYNITDEQTISKLREYVIKEYIRGRTVKKDEAFHFLVKLYGCMDKDDFNFAWDVIKREKKKKKT